MLLNIQRDSQLARNYFLGNYGNLYFKDAFPSGHYHYFGISLPFSNPRDLTISEMSFIVAGKLKYLFQESFLVSVLINKFPNNVPIRNFRRLDYEHYRHRMFVSQFNNRKGCREWNFSSHYYLPMLCVTSCEWNVQQHNI